MALQKQWNVKVYGQDGVTLKLNVPPSNLASNPSFTTRINNGQGECVLDLVGPSFKFDSFGEGTTLAFSFVVEIWCVDANNPLGRRIYKGYVSRIEPYFEAKGLEGVKVTCLGLVSLLSRSYYQTGGGNYTVTQTADPTAIGKAIVDHFNTIFSGNLISYDSTSIPATVGATVNYTFTDRKWVDALTQTQTLAGTNWWWSIDQDGKYNFQAKPSSATWVFTIGKDVQSIKATKDAEKVINQVQVRRNGGTAVDYSDSTSQTTYGTGNPATGRNTQIISDTSILDATTSDQRGNKAIADGKDAKVSATVVLNTQADLEGIRIGDACRIRNLSTSSVTFNDCMQIVSLQYDGDSLTIQLESITNDLGTALNSFVNG